MENFDIIEDKKDYTSLIAKVILLIIIILMIIELAIGKSFLL